MAGPIFATVFAVVCYIAWRGTERNEPIRWARRGIPIEDVPDFRVRVVALRWGFRLFALIAVVSWVVTIFDHLTN